MSKKSPSPPSPESQAKAQGAQDKETSWYNAMLANMDQFTPYGNLTYQNLGTKDAPKWQSTTTLSPEQQQMFDSQNRQGIAMNQLGEEQISRIGDAVSSPFSYGGIQNTLPTYGDISTASSRAEEALMSRLNPQFQQQEEALRTRLINQGIGQGSEAYQREMDSFNQMQNDARMQAILGGQQYGSNEQNMALQRRGQEIDEYTTQRNAPLNEYIGLTSGTQIQNPQFSSGGNQGIGSFDMAGAMNNYYSNQQAAANNKNAATSSMFGLGGQLLGGGGGGGSNASSWLGTAATVASLFSDIRLKENIEPVGKENGYNLYKFNYIGKPDKTYIGVIAQEVEKIKPEAVTEINGFKAVNYDMIGLKMTEVTE